MAYPTICDECLVNDHDHCGESKLKLAYDEIMKWNQDHPDDFLVGGGFCVCGHGIRPEGKFEQSVRESVNASNQKEI
jgi:hypothetical protein